jgi:hypothetical protein
MTTDRRAWIDRYAAELGVSSPSDDDVETLLALAGTAAHASERTAAPLSCWLAGTAGASPEEALAAARRLADELGTAG